MKLDDLNRKYFALYDELYHAQRFLTEKQFDVMSKTLQQQYSEELEVTLMEKAIDIGKNTFELRFKSRMYVPRRVWFCYNKIAKKLLKQYQAEFMTYMNSLGEKHEDKESHALMSVNTSLTVDNSTQSQEER